MTLDIEGKMLSERAFNRLKAECLESSSTFLLISSFICKQVSCTYV